MVVLKSRIVLPLLALLMAGCSTPNVNFPYKMDIQQGNVVTQDMVAKLRQGMTKSQVRYIMGTPLVTDVFHANRWDYVYSFQKAGKLSEERRITLIFDQDVLQRMEGDVVSAPVRDSQAPAPEGKPEAVPDKAKPEPGAANKEERGFFGRMLEKVGL